MDWRNQIPGCFGSVDHVFAGHPLDENRAFALLASLRTHGIGWAKVEPEFRVHLEHKHCGSDHIRAQLARLESRFRPWLID
jgi:hypothetical protein